MLDNFYEDASVPKALRLKETSPKFEFLEDELNLMLDSPACIACIDLSTNKIVSAIINTVWQVDNDFDAFKVDGIEYLNLAAVIAHEVTIDPLMRIVIWRDYQFQLIYHLLQAHAQKRGADYILYGGMGYVMPEYRGLGFAPLFWSIGAKWAQSNNSLFSFIGTYQHFSGQVHRTHPGKFSSLGFIPFDSLKFNPHKSNNDSVFKGIESGMNLMAVI